jgi:hypothetical protein
MEAVRAPACQFFQQGIDFFATEAVTGKAELTLHFCVFVCQSQRYQFLPAERDEGLFDSFPAAGAMEG